MGYLSNKEAGKNLASETEIRRMTPSCEQDVEMFPHGCDYARISTTIPAIKMLRNNREDYFSESD